MLFRSRLAWRHHNARQVGCSSSDVDFFLIHGVRDGNAEGRDEAVGSQLLLQLSQLLG